MLQSAVRLLSISSHTALLTNLKNPNIFSMSSFFFTTPSSHRNHQRQLKQPTKKHHLLGFCVGYEVGRGYLDAELGVKDRSKASESGNQRGGAGHLCSSRNDHHYMNMEETSEEVVVELDAQGVIGKRVDQGL